MTERFKRIYEDVDVFCIDTNKRGCQLIGREDYDKIVDLLNELAEENEEFRKRTKELIAVSLDYPTINLDLIAEAIKSLRELIE